MFSKLGDGPYNQELQNQDKVLALEKIIFLWRSVNKQCKLSAAQFSPKAG